MKEQTEDIGWIILLYMQILEEMEVEKFVKEQKGRYITIDTEDTDTFTAARVFYELNGYEKVSHFPNYYDEGSRKIDYYKKINVPDLIA